MLLLAVEWMTKNRNLQFPHKGTVEDNDDPLKLGRIKVSIEGLLESDDVDALPWIDPYNPYFLGTSTGSLWFSVPEVGAEVVVAFPYEDIYFGFYIGSWNSMDKPTTFDASYPEAYGFKDSSGNYVRIDKSGDITDINLVGDVNVTIGGNLTANVGGNVTADVTGNIEATAGGNIEATAGGDITVHASGGISITADGNTTVTGTGSMSVTASQINLNS